MQSEELMRELPKGLIKWYDFEKAAKTLFITCGKASDKIMSEALSECGLSVTCLTEQELLGMDGMSKFTYIVMAGALERSREITTLLSVLRGCLAPGGRLLIGAENRFGIRYFCGDRDEFSGRNFDGIDNYARLGTETWKTLEGHTYTKAEYKDMLTQTGWKCRFCSVLPALERPQALYAEDYLPQEELEVRIFPQYRSPDTVFIQEEKLYSSLIQNGMFHAMANGYLIECSLDASFSNAQQVTISMDRGKENAMATIIRKDGFVEKRAMYTEGRIKLQKLLENTSDLVQHGVQMVDARIDGDAFLMPYIDARTATEYFRDLLLTDKEMFLQKLDAFWEIILKSSEHVPYEDVNWERVDPEWEKRREDDPNKDKWRKIAFGSEEQRENLGVILKRGYIDLVCLNCFAVQGEFVFYDQEFFIENLPAKTILFRTIAMIYSGDVRLEALLPQMEVFKHYKMDAYLELWRRMSWCFTVRLCREKDLAVYHQLCRINYMTMEENRLRMNYSQQEYDRLFCDIFKGTEGKKIYLFGSGRYAVKFLESYSKEYEIEGILDNNAEKWNTDLKGYMISSPDILRSLQEESYKVIICIRDCTQVMKQLECMGIKNYGIYNPNISYPRKPRVIQKTENVHEKKKYRVGYIAGVFDLFHMGHLNMFKRAKEQCEYLIVGVVTDESVRNYKKTTPYIPFEERIEIVRSCRYVDEAVEIPADRGDTDEAYRRYQFDVQFSGSDYENDPLWLAKKAFLQKHGSDLVFFPYTQSTSSTQIKKKIRNEEEMR